MSHHLTKGTKDAKTIKQEVEKVEIDGSASLDLFHDPLRRALAMFYKNCCVVFIDLKAFCSGSSVICVCFKVPAYEIALLQHYIHSGKIFLHAELPTKNVDFALIRLVLFFFFFKKV